MTASSEGTSSRRRKPQQARSRHKVERILATSRRLLESEGPVAFNTNRVAKEAGISVGSLYEYFPNKEAIAARLLDDIDQGERETIMQAFADLGDAPLAEALRLIVTLTFSLYRQHCVLVRALRSVGGSGEHRREGIRPGEEAIVDAIHERLQRHRDEVQRPDLRLAALFVFYTVEALAFSSVTHSPPEWSAQTWIDECIASLSAYLKNP